MNAPQPNTGNSMSCLFSRRSDFWQLRDHILTAGARRQFLGKHGPISRVFYQNRVPYAQGSVLTTYL